MTIEEKLDDIIAAIEESSRPLGGGLVDGALRTLLKLAKDQELRLSRAELEITALQNHYHTVDCAVWVTSPPKASYR